MTSLYKPATFETLECNLTPLSVQQIGIIYILLAVPITERDYVTHEADFVYSVPHFVECSPCVTVKNYEFVFLDLHHGYVPSTIRSIFGTLECILMLIAVQQTCLLTPPIMKRLWKFYYFFAFVNLQHAVTKKNNPA